MDQLKSLIEQTAANPSALVTSVLVFAVIGVFINMLLKFFIALSDQLEANITESGHDSGFGLGLMRYYEERPFMSPEQRNRPLPELPRCTSPEIQAIAKAEIVRLFGRAA
jgi:hypothetical protein